MALSSRVRRVAGAIDLPSGSSAFIGFISQVGIAVMLPLLPLYATELGAPPFVLGLLTSSFAVTNAIGPARVGVPGRAMGRAPHDDRRARPVRRDERAHRDGRQRAVAARLALAGRVRRRGDDHLRADLPRPGRAARATRVLERHHLGRPVRRGRCGAGGRQRRGGHRRASSAVRARGVDERDRVRRHALPARADQRRAAGCRGGGRTGGTRFRFGRSARCSSPTSRCWRATARSSRPTRPMATTRLGWSIVEVGIAFSFFGAGSIVLGPWLAHMADRVGRRPIAVLAPIPLAGFAVGLVTGLPQPADLRAGLRGRRRADRVLGLVVRPPRRHGRRASPEPHLRHHQRGLDDRHRGRRPGGRRAVGAGRHRRRACCSRR